MKKLFLLFSLFALSLNAQYLFLVDSYDKEIELEAKIIAKIAQASLNEEIKLYIPDITPQEKQVYMHHFQLVDDCKEANFIFNKRASSFECETQDKLYFTNNYRKLLSDQRYYGAFFWSKSRPNIVFVKERLAQNNVHLSSEYAQFIEEF